MKAKLTLIASALLLLTNIAGAQEQKAPSGPFLRFLAATRVWFPRTLTRPASKSWALA